MNINNPLSKEKAEAKIEEWSAKINSLEAKMQLGKIDNKQKLDTKIKELSDKIATLKKEIKELEKMTAYWLYLNSRIETNIKQLDFAIEEIVEL